MPPWLSDLRFGRNKEPVTGFVAGLGQQGEAASGFGSRGEGEYAETSAEGRAERERLRRIMEGRDSVSAGQIRQGLQQAIAAQRSMAAGSAPNAAGRARMAAKQMGLVESGGAGLTALAGMQERQAAEQALANLIMSQRQQDLQAALASRGQSIAGYGGGYATQIGVPRKPSDAETYLPGIIQGGAGLLSLYAASDKRLKTASAPGEEKARAALDGLRAYTFRYKDKKHGEGEQLGVMAQDLERAGMGHAVIDTPSGKMVHGAKLATTLAAMLPGIDKRIAKLEGRSK